MLAKCIKCFSMNLALQLKYCGKKDIYYKNILSFFTKKKCCKPKCRPISKLMSLKEMNQQSDQRFSLKTALLFSKFCEESTFSCLGQALSAVISSKCMI